MRLHVPHDRRYPLQMSRRHHQKAIGVLLAQAAVDGEQDGFFTLVCTASEQHTSPLHPGCQGMRRCRLLGGKQSAVNIGVADYLQARCNSAETDETLRDLWRLDEEEGDIGQHLTHQPPYPQIAAKGPRGKAAIDHHHRYMLTCRSTYQMRPQLGFLDN
jgi:hypothetical protein